jgi:protein ImuB
LVLSQQVDNAQRIAAMNQSAEALGLKRNMGVADARAMHPSLEVLDADPLADARMLARIAEWCDHYTPLVALDGADGLMLDISGCAHLFGGEDAMLKEITWRLSMQGFDARAGLASTPGTAWAAARFCGSHVIKVKPGCEEDALAALPLAALRIEPETQRKLENVGLRCVGALLGAPRGPLARRFGRLLITRLDQALGIVEEAISPRLPVPAFSVERRLAEPISVLSDVEQLLLLLARTLKQDLERRNEGARQLTLSLFRVDGAVTRFAVNTSRPLREPEAIAALFREKFAVLENSLDPGLGFELVRLAAVSTAPFHGHQEDLTGESINPQQEAFLHMMDRLRARLGDQAVLLPAPARSHMPERQAIFMRFNDIVPLATSGAQQSPIYWDDGSTVTAQKLIDAEDATPVRPLRLLAKPEPVEAAAEVPEGPPLSFRWRKALYRIARAEGPERIAPEWWLTAKAPLPRDYFRVEDTEGRRFWLYREGIYDGDKMPRWFLHGLFS